MILPFFWTLIFIRLQIYKPVLLPYAPKNLLYTMWKNASHLAGYEQRDAHEVLITLLTLIHSHLVGEQAPREGASTLLPSCTPSTSYNVIFTYFN